jgi:hypothetical protein
LDEKLSEVHGKLDYLLDNTQRISKQIDALSDQLHSMRTEIVAAIERLHEERLFLDSYEAWKVAVSHIEALKTVRRTGGQVSRRRLLMHEQIAAKLGLLPFRFETARGSFAADVYLAAAFYTTAMALYNQHIAEHLLAQHDPAVIDHGWYMSLIDQLEKELQRFLAPEGIEARLASEQAQHTAVMTTLLTTSAGKKLAPLLGAEGKVGQSIWVCADGPHRQVSEMDGKGLAVGFVGGSVACVAAAVLIPGLGTSACLAMIASGGLGAGTTSVEVWDRVIYPISISHRTVLPTGRDVISLQLPHQHEWWSGIIRQETSPSTPRHNLSCQATQFPKSGNVEEFRKAMGDLERTNVHAYREYVLSAAKQLASRTKDVLRILRERMLYQ